MYIDSVQDNFAQQEDLSKSILSYIIEESSTLIAIITSSIQDIKLDNIDNINGVCKDIKHSEYAFFLFELE